MASSASKVFISYNRTDRDWAEWIAGAIESAGYEPIIQAWHFRPGENFVLRMQEAAAQTDFTIAVLSETYVKSEYTQPEWAAAFAQDPIGKKRKLIPVRVSECALTGMLVPIVHIDLIGLGESDAKRALLDGFKPSGRPAQPQPFPGKRAEYALSTAPFPPNVARLYGVPDLPPHYLPREAALNGLKRKLLIEGAPMSAEQFSIVGVHGMGGIGKTVLAAALAHDSEVRQAFPDGIYWLTVGKEPDLFVLQNQFLTHLTRSKHTLTTQRENRDAREVFDIDKLADPNNIWIRDQLREALEGKCALVVLDDVWTIDHADSLLVTAPPARSLITTRNHDVLVDVGAEEHRVDLLSSSDALKMLADWVGQKRIAELPTEAAEVARECGYLPLALAMIGAMIRSRRMTWTAALIRLRRVELEAIKRNFPGYPYPDLLRAITVSIEALKETDRERYLDLAVFPGDQAIPESALCVLWNLGEVDARDCMGRLLERSVATSTEDGTSLILHDLQHGLIRKWREKDLPGLHLRLVKAWHALPKLPDVYAWRWVTYHLAKAERKDDLRRLLLDFNYLEAKLAATDTKTLIADYYYLPDKDLQLVQSAIRISAHILAHNPRELPGQLIGRLPVSLSEGIDALISQASEHKSFGWLRPLKPSLTQLAASLVRTLEGHTASVHAVAVTPDGRHVVSGSDDKTLRVWELATGETQTTLHGHRSSINGVAVTPDGRHVVSGSWDSTLRVWNLATGKTRITLRGHTHSVNTVAVTPDGRHVVSGSMDNTLRVWDLATGETKATLQGHTVVAITPDGRHVISGSWGNTLRVCNLATGETKNTLQGHTDSVSAIAVTPDGCLLISGSRDYTLRVWDLATGETKTRLQGHTSSVNAVAVTPDSRHVVSGSHDKTVRVWDLATGKTKTTLSHPFPVNAVMVTLDGRYIVSGSADNRLRIWDLATGETNTTPKGDTRLVYALAVTPDGRHVVSSSADGRLRVWDLATGETKTTFQGQTDKVYAVAVTPDGRHVVSGSEDSRLRIWDLVTGKTKITLQGHTASVHAVAVTPDGRHVVSGSDDKTLRVWELATGKTKVTLHGHTASVNAVAVTPDGRHVVSGSWDNTLRVWELATGETKITLQGRTASVDAVAVTPDGSHVVSGSPDKTLRVRDSATWETETTPQRHTRVVNPVAITPDGCRAVSGSWDNALRVWDLATGEIKMTLQGHTGWVHAAAVTPDGRHVVSGSADHTLRVWDLEDGKESLSFTVDGRVTACIVSQDNRTIVAGDDFGRLHFLRIVEADETKPAIGDTRLPLLIRERQSTDSPKEGVGWRIWKWLCSRSTPN